MLTLSTQQAERLNALMIAGGFQSEGELFNAMLADFEYHQQLRELRKAIQAGIDSGEAEEIRDVGAFFNALTGAASNG